MSKYVIEIEEKPLCVFDKDTQTFFPRLWRVKGFNSLVLDEEGLSRLEVLNFDYINEHFSDLQDTAYQRGLDDAWECARKIVCDDSCGGMSMKELVEIFNKSSDAYILRDFTAQQAIEMLKAHKQEKDDNIEVGDEICNIDTDRNDTGIVTWRAHDDIYVMWTDGSAGRRNIKDYRKTGRHFDIAKILEDMRHD